MTEAEQTRLDLVRLKEILDDLEVSTTDPDDSGIAEARAIAGRLQAMDPIDRRAELMETPKQGEKHPRYPDLRYDGSKHRWVLKEDFDRRYRNGGWIACMNFATGDDVFGMHTVRQVDGGHAAGSPASAARVLIGCARRFVEKVLEEHYDEKPEEARRLRGAGEEA